jgi:AcrR family transcriptional regulator
MAEAEEGARYKRIVRAADALFRASGFRGVTMEAVAREAAVAKATLYSYFRDKDALFVAVSSRMAAMLRKAFADELGASGKTLDQRVADAIVGRYRAGWEYQRSPHGEELVSHKYQLAAHHFTQAIAAMMAQLEAVLRQDPALAPDAPRLARAVFYGSGELAARSDSLAALEGDIAAFVVTHLAGARALAHRP